MMMTLLQFKGTLNSRIALEMTEKFEMIMEALESAIDHAKTLSISLSLTKEQTLIRQFELLRCDMYNLYDNDAIYPNEQK